MENYNHKEIEPRLQKKWATDELYKTEDSVEGKENFYALVEFPYPSGNLHVGHWHAFAVPDIFARFKRMKGFNVLYPIGFDAFGLPAENAAIKNNADPAEWTYANIEHMEEQLRSMGNTFDWSRKIVTCTPDYYKWNQWLFLKLFEKGIAYRGESLVNWDPVDQTVLANEQVLADGTAERSGAKVEQRKLTQWMLKITDYADRLVDDLSDLEWPSEIKEAQKNWIGKSNGSELTFKIKEVNSSINVFTTRADTLFGATYIVIAPEHEVVDELQNSVVNIDEVKKYIKEAKSKDTIERTDQKKEKTGVKLEGVTAINPATSEEIPVYIADYVLRDYGTGAVMGVPAHDERDFEFAKKYDLSIHNVIAPHIIDKKNPPKEGKKTVERRTIHAIVKNPKDGKVLCLKWKEHDWITFVVGGVDDGEDLIEAAKREVAEETGYVDLELEQILGAPVHAEYFAAHKDENRIAITTCIVFTLKSEKKVALKQEEHEKFDIVWLETKDITPESMTCAELGEWLSRIDGNHAYTGEGKLVSSGEFSGMNSTDAKVAITNSVNGELKSTYKIHDWVISRQRYWGTPIPIVYSPEGKAHPIPSEHLPWKLPTDVDYTPKGTSPLGSSKELKERTEKIFGKGWTPENDTMDVFVDSSWYFLRYLDFDNSEEFSSIEKQKLWMPVGRYSGGSEHTTVHVLYARFMQKALFDLGLVTTNEPFTIRMNRGLIMGTDGQKMSKRWGNVVDPDDQVALVGADTVKMYLAFIGPYNEVGHYPWNQGGIAGIRRYLERVWRLHEKVSTELTDSAESLRELLHKTVKKVGEDIEAMKFNTAIASLMTLQNMFDKDGNITIEDFKIYLRLLAPFAPHMSEEIWSRLGEKDSIHKEVWPQYSERLIEEKETTLGVQINGKVRSQITISHGTKKEKVEKKVLEDPIIKKWIVDKTIKQFIYIEGRVVNIVV